MQSLLDRFPGAQSRSALIAVPSSFHPLRKRISDPPPVWFRVLGSSGDEFVLDAV